MRLRTVPALDHQRRGPSKAWTAAAILAALVGAHAVLAAAPAGRPNIIVLMDDQHRWDGLGCVDPAMKTPALDRLAADGIRFSQAVCQAPMCVPSRYSLMLGLYPNQTGILSNGPGLDDAQLPCEALPELMRKAGYQTAGFGKTHWSAKQMSTRGFEVRFAATDAEEGAVRMGADALRRYNEETKDYGGGEENIAGYLGRTSAVPEAEHRDGWVFNRCLEFLEKGRDPARPLFLYLSFLKPHAAHNVPAGFEGLYDLNAMPVPVQPAKELVEPCHATGTNREQMYRPFWSQASEAEWRQMILRYRANCSWIDSMFGRVMDRLKEKGLLENSLVIYLSDHGEMLGERYYRFNKYCLFESSVRVPLIVAGTAVPRERKGTTDARPAELVDVLPTILAAAGIPTPGGKPGENLLGPAVRKAGFCEFNDQPGTLSFMWRTAERKLILTFPKDAVRKGAVQLSAATAGEFYDLKADAREWTNLHARAEHRAEREAMGRDLVAHLNAVALRPQASPRR